MAKRKLKDVSTLEQDILTNVPKEDVVNNTVIETIAEKEQVIVEDSAQNKEAHEKEDNQVKIQNNNEQQKITQKPKIRFDYLWNGQVYD